MRTPARVRIDRLIVQKGLAESREKAARHILAGEVFADGTRVDKAGALVPVTSKIEVRGGSRYVSRGGDKLIHALEQFKVTVTGRVCLDVGASTGGFTDCLLQRGATRVFAVDVGTNQLDWKLRHDPRLVVLEKTNARYLTLKQIDVVVALATMDVSFISSTLILPALTSLLEQGADLLVLVKPQFEVGRKQVGKGGIVRDPQLHQEAIEKVSGKLRRVGFTDIDCAESILPGAEGNREYFLHARWRNPGHPEG